MCMWVYIVACQMLLQLKNKEKLKNSLVLISSNTGNS
jgi:fructoselysine-6-P-deglycase FrlB-like protein